jgi:hypothetical protein
MTGGLCECQPLPNYQRPSGTQRFSARAEKFQKPRHVAEKPMQAKGLRTIVDVMETPRPPRRNPGGRPRKVTVPDVAPDDLDPVLVLKMIAGCSAVPPAVRAAACRTLLLVSRADGGAAEPEAVSAKLLNARTLQILRRAN